MNSRGEEVHDNFSTMLSLQNFSKLDPCQEGRDMTRCRQWFSMVFHFFLAVDPVGWSNDVLNPDGSRCGTRLVQGIYALEIQRNFFFWTFPKTGGI